MPTLRTPDNWPRCGAVDSCQRVSRRCADIIATADSDPKQKFPTDLVGVLPEDRSSAYGYPGKSMPNERKTNNNRTRHHKARFKSSADRYPVKWWSSGSAQ